MSPHGNSGTLEYAADWWPILLRTKTLRIKSGPGAPICTGFSAYRDETHIILLAEGGEMWQAGIFCTLLLSMPGPITPLHLFLPL